MEQTEVFRLKIEGIWMGSKRTDRQRGTVGVFLHGIGKQVWLVCIQSAVLWATSAVSEATDLHALCVSDGKSDGQHYSEFFGAD